MATIVWFRQDLRLGDNPALSFAAKSGDVVPIYIFEQGSKVAEKEPIGSASRWWLHYSLSALQERIGGLGVFAGDPRVLIPEILSECGAQRIVWNRCYEPKAVERDTAIKTDLTSQGIVVKSFNAGLLVEPWHIKTQSGGPFKVFTPYWRALQKFNHDAPARAAKATLDKDKLAKLPSSISELDLLPKNPNWAAGWDRLWEPGEKGAAARLKAFILDGLEGYAKLRDRPDKEHISRLSPHLHFGEISPRQIWASMSHVAAQHPSLAQDSSKFMSELAWREFSTHLLFHFPKLATENWKPDFDAYPWRKNKAHLNAWQQGMTGYPMVDAGMRELWQTGFMHNRVRMLVASFLIKHLRLHWRHGQAWFHDTLLDADLANNSASWQWVAGSGADAAPYFRIFNPIIQGQKFDPDGDYVRRWCPELAELDTKYIHCPFDAPEEILNDAGIKLGVTYPNPLVDHQAARNAALEGYKKVQEQKS